MSGGDRLGWGAPPAPWRSGYAAACKAVYTGSIPVGASPAGITAWAAAEATARLKLEALKKALQELHLGMVSGRVAGDALELVDDAPSGEAPLPELTPQ